MRLNEYQVEAGKSIDRYFFNNAMEDHALHGMATELGKLNALCLREQQGTNENQEQIKRNRMGDMFWYFAEYCTAHNWSMDDIAQESLHRMQSMR
ncbi:hypothetical protein BXO88_02775 [Oribacterium sp. C9]|uniref:hypothetical protein n=1 Tax=Oribacterium sp. C9 TaxID=1943579 RepID=UPI00098F96EF|nr:hypothetical protein [Oribacterium sp. C9]OON87618.1 hypothetical protein BXO88_02775 [Oribacterium sp. C9]